jgi:hypothetical protein
MTCPLDCRQRQGSVRELLWFTLLLSEMADTLVSYECLG